MVKRRVRKYNRRYGRKRYGARKFARRAFGTGVTYKFKRRQNEATSGTIEADPGSAKFGAFGFYLSDTHNTSEFTNLFDQYKITGVKVEFVPRTQPTIQSTGPQWDPNTSTWVLPPQQDTVVPNLYVTTDFDDINPPTTIDSVKEYQGSIRVPMNRYRKIFIRPRPQMALFTSPGVSSGIGVPVRAPWLDCAQTGVPHLGLKWAAEQTSVSGAGNTHYSMYVRLTYYLMFRKVR